MDDKISDNKNMFRRAKLSNNKINSLIYNSLLSLVLLCIVWAIEVNLDREERQWNPQKTYLTQSEFGDMKYCEEFVFLNKTGKFEFDKYYEPTWEEVNEATGSEVENGCWKPKNCISRQQLLIIVPYRDREKHLKLLLYKLHPLLQSQYRDYCIVVSEQYDGGLFNSGMLKNAGFLEAANSPHFAKRGLETNCIVIQDVDLLPENDLNGYVCPDKYTVHLSDRIDKMEYQKHSGGSLGGVAMIPRDTYEISNGHSNMFWGWGGEDGDMGWRVHYSMGGNYLLFPHDGIGTYKMMEHLHPWTNFPKPPSGNNVIDFMNGYVAASTGVLKVHRTLRQRYDGLNTVSYSVKEKETFHSHVKYKFEIRKMSFEKFTQTIKPSNSDPIELFNRFMDADIGKPCNVIDFEKGCSVEDKFLNSQYTADKVNCSDTTKWCDSYGDKCISVFYNGEQNHVDEVLQKQATKLKRRDKDVAARKYNAKAKMGAMERALYKKNYTDITDTDWWIEMMMGTTCSIRLIPHPLKSCENEFTRSFIKLKNCPGNQGLFQIKEEPVYLDFGNSGIDIDMNLEYTGRILQKFDGLVTYRDTLLYEGRRISTANLPVDLMWEEIPGINNKAEKEIHGVTENHSVRVERLDPEDPAYVKVVINFKLRKALPGFYVLNTKLMDDFFQPYVEFNSVFRLQTKPNPENPIKSAKHDENLRKKYSASLFDQSGIEQSSFVEWRDRARKNLLALRKYQKSFREDTYLEPIPIQQARLDALEDGEFDKELRDRRMEERIRQKAIEKAEQQGLDSSDELLIDSIMQELKEKREDNEVNESDVSKHEEKRISEVNWRFRNIEESHAGRWLNSAVRMLDEIVVNQEDQISENQKKIGKTKL